jgi:hypothetical protein
MNNRINQLVANDYKERMKRTIPISERQLIKILRNVIRVEDVKMGEAAI